MHLGFQNTILGKHIICASSGLSQAITSLDCELSAFIATEEFQKFPLPIEPPLCFQTGIPQNGRIPPPALDSVVIFASMLIINDKRSDLVTKTFFHHNQPANSAVVIIERMNLLKAHMEIQDGI